MSLVGEHGLDTGHDGESGEEQALENEGVVDIGRGGPARDRHTPIRDRDVLSGAQFRL